MGLRKIIAKASASSNWTKNRTTNIEVAAPTNAQVRLLRRLLIDIRLMRPDHATGTTIGEKSTLKNFAGVVFCGHPFLIRVLTGQQQCPSNHEPGALSAIGQIMEHMLGS